MPARGGHARDGAGDQVDYVTLSDEARSRYKGSPPKVVERAADLRRHFRATDGRRNGLSGIAAALTERGIPTARGGSSGPRFRRRVLARLP
jgi:hypothetical protein